MKLQGSCHCGKVTFSLESPHPYPFNRCYCSICRKTAGAGGYAINIGGEHATLEVQGREHVRIYQALLRQTGSKERTQSPAQRHFCGVCGSALWIWDPRWPELVHPHASAIDTDLPQPPENTHMMLGSKASWVEVCRHDRDKLFDEYPKESLADWHIRLGVEQ